MRAALSTKRKKKHREPRQTKAAEKGLKKAEKGPKGPKKPTYARGWFINDHPLAGQYCPTLPGVIIFAAIVYACRSAPDYVLEIAMPPLAFVMTALAFMCCPHTAKPIPLIFVYNHGLRAIWWLWLGPMPFILFCIGMTWPLVPAFGTKPQLWSPTGGTIIGLLTYKFGVRVVYDCHAPEIDCDYSGGAPDKGDALCEIEHDVLFLDLGSDGHVWPERLLLLLLVIIMVLATIGSIFGIHGRNSCELAQLMGATLAHGLGGLAREGHHHQMKSRRDPLPA